MRPQPCTANYRQPRDTESERNSPFQEKLHLLVIFYQMINPKDKHTSIIIQAEKVIFRNIHIVLNIYIYVISFLKEAINIKDYKEEYMGGYGERNKK